VSRRRVCHDSAKTQGLPPFPPSLPPSHIPNTDQSPPHLTIWTHISRSTSRPSPRSSVIGSVSHNESHLPAPCIHRAGTTEPPPHARSIRVERQCLAPYNTSFFCTVSAPTHGLGHHPPHPSYTWPTAVPSEMAPAWLSDHHSESVKRASLAIITNARLIMLAPKMMLQIGRQGR